MIGNGVTETSVVCSHPAKEPEVGDGGWHLFIRHTGGWSDRWMVRQVDGETAGGWSDSRWMVRQVDGETGGWSDSRWMVRQVDGQTAGGWVADIL